MERKRELTSVDLAALVTELRGYLGASVQKVYRYGEDLLRFRLRDADSGRVELLVEVGDVKRANVADPANVPDAPDRPPDFAMQLRNRLAGADLVGVDQHGFDRVLELAFDGADGPATVVAELFGDGNVVVLDADRQVVQCLETVRLSSRTVAPGAPYEFPAARFDPTSADAAAFAARFEASDSDVVRTLATQLNFGGRWAEELCTRAGVEKTADVSTVEASTVSALYEAVRRLDERLTAGNLDPRVYHEADEGDAVDGDGTGEASPRGRRVDVAPLGLEERSDLPSVAFDSFNAALEDYFDTDDPAPETGEAEPDFEDEIAELERIIQQQEAAVEEFGDRAERTRRDAELLYEHYDLVDDVISTVSAARDDGHPWDEIAERFQVGAKRGVTRAEAVTDVDGDDGTVAIQLGDRAVRVDPSTDVEHNADRLYQEAKRLEEKGAGAEAAVEETRSTLAEVLRRREAVQSGEETDDGVDADPDPADWCSRSSIPVRRTDQWFERFRWFHTSDGFLVLGGRNADQNEELVGKYMESGDLFLHAAAHGGPVTLLKATGPSEPSRDVDIPERSQTEAARFAVSYSSVWKEGAFADDAYAVDPDQVSKTPESGEYLEKGGFAVRGDRTYFRDVPVGIAVGIQCESQTRVIGGPPAPIETRAVTTVRLEPGRYAGDDVATKLYRTFRDRFEDTSFVRRVASPDQIQGFLPPGGSRLLDD